MPQSIQSGLATHFISLPLAFFMEELLGGGWKVKEGTGDVGGGMVWRKGGGREGGGGGTTVGRVARRVAMVSALTGRGDATSTHLPLPHGPPDLRERVRKRMRVRARSRVRLRKRRRYRPRARLFWNCPYLVPSPQPSPLPFFQPILIMEATPGLSFSSQPAQRSSLFIL